MLDTLSRETLAVPHNPAAAEHGVVAQGWGRPRALAAPVAVPPPSLRLTRRGRLVLVAVVATLLLLAFSIGRVMSNAAPSGSAKPTTHTVVVAPGDTAWSIARAAMPRLDGRDAVDRLLALNHSDGRLQVGQTLVVPGS
jgi:Tfp pilus assembly protein FimV